MRPCNYESEMKFTREQMPASQTAFWKAVKRPRGVLSESQQGEAEERKIQGFSKNFRDFPYQLFSSLNLWTLSRNLNLLCSR